MDFEIINRLSLQNLKINAVGDNDLLHVFDELFLRPKMNDSICGKTP